MKEIVLKHISVFMAFLVMLSTVSVTIEKHYCGGDLIDVGVFEEAEKCSMEMTAKSVVKSCCEDVVDIVEGQDELKITLFEDLDLKQQEFIIAYLITFVDPFENLPEQIVPFKHYNPPKLFKDIHVLDEVFLI